MQNTPPLFSSRSIKKHSCGFTLLEVILVLIILALVSVPISKSINFSYSPALKSEQARMIARLIYVRAKAMNVEAGTNLCLTLNNNGTGTYSNSCPPMVGEAQNFSLQNGVTAQTEQTFCFTRNGLSTETAEQTGTLYSGTGSDAASASFTVSPTGFIYAN